MNPALRGKRASGLRRVCVWQTSGIRPDVLGGGLAAGGKNGARTPPYEGLDEEIPVAGLLAVRGDMGGVGRVA